MVSICFLAIEMQVTFGFKHPMDLPKEERVTATGTTGCPTKHASWWIV